MTSGSSSELESAIRKCIAKPTVTNGEVVVRALDGQSENTRNTILWMIEMIIGLEGDVAAEKRLNETLEKFLKEKFKVDIKNVNIAQSGDQNVAQTGEGTQEVNTVVNATPRSSRAKYFTVGAVCLALAIGLAIWAFALGTLTPDQRKILLWALPIASGFACSSFAGGISAKAQGIVPGLLVTATGGFAVWLITFLLLF